MTSSRTNDDIQSELVEILGFEGQGLALVEELLRPGARDILALEINGETKVSPRPYRADTETETSPRRLPPFLAYLGHRGQGQGQKADGQHYRHDWD